MTLSDLSDESLADEVRRRELALQEGQAELHKRNRERGHSEWNESVVGAMLAQKRSDRMWHPKVTEKYPTDLPPPLFRMGYEWAALTIVGIMEKILDRPSEYLSEYSTFEPAGRGLYRVVGKPQLRDPKREAAISLLELIEGWAARNMFFVMPPRRQP